MKIETNQIDWIKNGERASAKTQNRPIEQLLDNVNKNFEETDKVKQNKLLTINNLNSNITEDDLSKVLIKSLDTTVEDNLPIGWNCIVVASENIEINLVSDKFLDGTSSISVEKLKSVNLVKVSNNAWVNLTNT